uniref:Putative secreted peptide n=1 Tax=Anopheles braziliensis TaxID=58242 RepID=A0A2M3ZW30_9DIPT
MSLFLLLSFISSNFRTQASNCFLTPTDRQSEELCRTQKGLSDRSSDIPHRGFRLAGQQPLFSTTIDSHSFHSICRSVCSSHSVALARFRFRTLCGGVDISFSN